MDLKDASFHIQIALHHRRFLRFALEGTAYEYPVLLGLALAPAHFLEVHGRSSSHPLRASGMRVLNYLDDWLIFAQSRDTPASHIDKLLRHLEFLRLCVNMHKSILAPSQSNVSGSVLRLKAGCHFVFPVPFQTGQFTKEHMRPLQFWLKSRVPWTAWTSGRLRIVVSRGYIEALRPCH